jgi:hypothetical protein
MGRPTKNEDSGIAAALLAGVALAALLEPWLLLPMALAVLVAVPVIIGDARASLGLPRRREKAPPASTPLDMYSHFKTEWLR